MPETVFEKQILTKLGHMEKSMNHILEYIKDFQLSDEDRLALQSALQEEKDGRLFTKKQVFG